VFSERETEKEKTKKKKQSFQKLVLELRTQYTNQWTFIFTAEY